MKLSTKAAVYKRVNFLIGGLSMSIGGPKPLAPLGACSTKILVFVQDGLGGGHGPRGPPWLSLCTGVKKSLSKMQKRVKSAYRHGYSGS